jgi:hypothetical protein
MKKNKANEKGNLYLIENVYGIFIICYFLLIFFYNMLVDRTFFLEEKYSMTAIWSPWFSVQILLFIILSLFIILHRLLILKFRFAWPNEFTPESLTDGFNQLFRLTFDSRSFGQRNAGQPYNNLMSLRTRSIIGYIFIISSVIIAPLIFYLLCWGEQLKAITIFRFIIFNINIASLFTLGILNICFGIESEIIKKFEAAKSSNVIENAELISVNFNGGWCRLNGKEYPIKLLRDESSKRIEELYIDKSAEDQKKYIYI